LIGTFRGHIVPVPGITPPVHTMSMKFVALALLGSALVVTAPAPDSVWPVAGSLVASAHAQAAKPAAPVVAQAGPKTTPVPGQPKSAIDPRTQEPDCAWIGKRTIRVLVRDDLIAAEGFMHFYTAFACPVPHLSEAFACTFGGLKEMMEFGFEVRVESCWADPRNQR